ncbi:ABC transporter substrate-binding protein [Actinomadura physcomitrii]|nr:ABC transporter substrate-binding protein [Actinomadura physcomitrii]
MKHLAATRVMLPGAPRRAVLAAGFATTLLMAAACGNGSVSSSTGVSGKEIKIGATLPLTGPAAAVGVAVRQGLDASVASVNAHGGINGRKLKGYWEDDQYNPAVTNGKVQKLINNDRIFAFVGFAGYSQLLAVKQQIDRAKVPVIGPVATGTKVNDPPQTYIFPVVANDTAETHQMVDTLVDRQVPASEIGIVYVQNDFGQGLLDNATAYLKSKHSTTPKAVVGVQAGASSVSAEVSKLKSSGAKGILVMLTDGDAASFLREAQRQGLGAQMIVSAGATSQKFLDLTGKSSEGVLGAGKLPVATDAGNPAVAQYQADMKKYQPGAAFSYYSLLAWTSVHAFAKAAEQAGDDLTRQGLIKALETWKNQKVGASAPLTFGPGNRTATNVEEILQVKNGVWTTAS